MLWGKSTVTQNTAKSNNFIKISKEEIDNFKKSYNKCKPGETFFFEGEEILKEYAKYLIEYLESKFEQK